MPIATTTTTVNITDADGAEDLFLLMAQGRLQMPRLSEAATQAMVQSLHQLPSKRPSASPAHTSVYPTTP